MSITTKQIGEFIDSIAGKKRTPAAVAGRLMEEVVELCLSVGMTSGEIHSHVTDSLTNQAMKTSKILGKPVYPSEMKLSQASADVEDEVAYVNLVLLDLCHVTQSNLDASTIAKFDNLQTKKFLVSEAGTIYTVKPMI